MDLWIRSNNGKFLEKLEMVKVINLLPSKGNTKTNGIVVNCNYVYGEFETEERAIEIIDEIHNMDIENNPNFKVDEYRHKPIRVVYTMPQE